MGRDPSRPTLGAAAYPPLTSIMCAWCRVHQGWARVAQIRGGTRTEPTRAPVCAPPSMKMASRATSSRASNENSRALASMLEGNNSCQHVVGATAKVVRGDGERDRHELRREKVTRGTHMELCIYSIREHGGLLLPGPAAVSPVRPVPDHCPGPGRRRSRQRIPSIRGAVLSRATHRHVGGHRTFPQQGVGTFQTRSTLWRGRCSPPPPPPQVCASKFWFNYRHTSNAIAVYNSVRARGVPDARILLMLADDAACNGRNPAPACMRTRDLGPDDAYVRRGATLLTFCDRRRECP